MMKKLFLATLTLLASGCYADEPDVYLFSYFTDGGKDGLHLAYSEDGLNWTALKNNISFLTPTAGKDKLMRDPCIVYGGDNKFHMVWTVSWNEKGIGYADSPDLINWSDQQYIPVMEHEPEVRNCWAPELFYNDASGIYMIYWSTTIPGRFPESAGSSESDYNHRIYYCTTRNFHDFSETKLLYDPGFNVIDASIYRDNGGFIMFLKNETKFPEVEKNIRIARSTSLTGPYSNASAAITDNWVEGPTAMKLDTGWIVYFDRYRQHNMGAVFSKDLENWTDISDRVDFPQDTRHGTILKVNGKILKDLQAVSEPEGD